MNSQETEWSPKHSIQFRPNRSQYPWIITNPFQISLLAICAFPKDLQNPVTVLNPVFYFPTPSRLLGKANKTRPDSNLPLPASIFKFFSTLDHAWPTFKAAPRGKAVGRSIYLLSKQRLRESCQHITQSYSHTKGDRFETWVKHHVHNDEKVMN